jgi:hypothetical protein
MKPADELAELWVATELDTQAIETVAISTWKTYQLIYFLDKILQKSPLPPGKRKWLISSSTKSRLFVWGALYQGQRELRKVEILSLGDARCGRELGTLQVTCCQKQIGYTCKSHGNQITKPGVHQVPRFCRHFVSSVYLLG